MESCNQIDYNEDNYFTIELSIKNKKIYMNL